MPLDSTAEDKFNRDIYFSNSCSCHAKRKEALSAVFLHTGCYKGIFQKRSQSPYFLEFLILLWHMFLCSLYRVPRSIILYNDEFQELSLDNKEKPLNYMLLEVADIMQFIIILKSTTKKLKERSIKISSLSLDAQALQFHAVTSLVNPKTTETKLLFVLLLFSWEATFLSLLAVRGFRHDTRCQTGT